MMRLGTKNPQRLTSLREECWLGYSNHFSAHDKAAAKYRCAAAESGAPSAKFSPRISGRKAGAAARHETS
jgi:hypothetical protein